MKKTLMRKVWWDTVVIAVATAPVIVASLFLIGCASRVMFVDPDTNVIRLGSASGEYFVQDNHGEWIRQNGKLPIGWYAVKKP